MEIEDSSELDDSTDVLKNLCMFCITYYITHTHTHTQIAISISISVYMYIYVNMIHLAEK